MQIAAFKRDQESAPSPDRPEWRCRSPSTVIAPPSIPRRFRARPASPPRQAPPTLARTLSRGAKEREKVALKRMIIDRTKSRPGSLQDTVSAPWIKFRPCCNRSVNSWDILFSEERRLQSCEWRNEWYLSNRVAVIPRCSEFASYVCNERHSYCSQKSLIFQSTLNKRMFSSLFWHPFSFSDGFSPFSWVWRRNTAMNRSSGRSLSKNIRRYT